MIVISSTFFGIEKAHDAETIWVRDDNDNGVPPTAPNEFDFLGEGRVWFGGSWYTVYHYGRKDCYFPCNSKGERIVKSDVLK